MRSLSLKRIWTILLVCLISASASLKAHAQASGSGDAGQALKEMQSVEDRWADAITKRDQFGLENILATQFIGISASGDVTTRDQQIARLFVKGSDPISIEHKVVSARFVDNVAIVNGTYVMHWKADGRPVDEKGIFSHVFEHTRAGWLCLNSQQTVVAESSKADEKSAEKSKPKTSNAALPFHIPLIYKGPQSNQPAPAPGTSSPQN